MIENEYDNCVHFILNQKDVNLEISLKLSTAYSKLDKWDFAYETLTKIKDLCPEIRDLFLARLNVLLHLNLKFELDLLLKNLNKKKSDWLKSYDPTIIYSYLYE